eukprot:1350902-Pyramimonas_sp.AAC.1
MDLNQRRCAIPNSTTTHARINVLDRLLLEGLSECSAGAREILCVCMCGAGASPVECVRRLSL